jgi:hypothetical protein
MANFRDLCVWWLWENRKRGIFFTVHPTHGHCCYRDSDTEIHPVEGSATMNKRIETTIAILAAFFVLLSAMFDVRITLVLAIIFLIALTIYHSIQIGKRHPHRLV